MRDDSKGRALITQVVDAWTNDEIDAYLVNVYTQNKAYLDLHETLLYDYPGLDVLREWMKAYCSEAFLDQAGLSRGMKRLLLLPFIEQGFIKKNRLIFINGEQ